MAVQQRALVPRLALLQEAAHLREGSAAGREQRNLKLWAKSVTANCLIPSEASNHSQASSSLHQKQAAGGGHLVRVLVKDEPRLLEPQPRREPRVHTPHLRGQAGKQHMFRLCASAQ